MSMYMCHNMYMYMHTYIYIYIYIYIVSFTCVYMCTQIAICKSICIHSCIYMCICIHTNGRSSFVKKHIVVPCCLSLFLYQTPSRWQCQIMVRTRGEVDPNLQSCSLRPWTLTTGQGLSNSPQGPCGNCQKSGALI